jgi:hypothetical protein
MLKEIRDEEFVSETPGLLLTQTIVFLAKVFSAWHYWKYRI